MHRVRRPLVALLVLVIALVVGYVVKAQHHDDSHRPARPAPSSTAR